MVSQIIITIKTIRCKWCAKSCLGFKDCPTACCCEHGMYDLLELLNKVD